MSGYRDNFTSFFHWFAWSIACIASIFFAIFVIGEGVHDIIKGKGGDLVLFLPGLLLAIIGCIVSFFRKIPGGIMMLIGGIIMVVTLYFQGGSNDYRMMMIYGFPYIFPGILFIFVRR